MSRYPHEITIVNNQAKSLSKVQNQKSKRKKHMYKTRKDSWHISNENEWSKLNRYAKIVRRLGSPVQRVYLVPCHVTKKVCNWLYNDYIIRKVVSTKTHIGETLVIILYTLTYYFKTLSLFTNSEKVQTNYQYNQIMIWVEILELILILVMFN